MTVKELIKYLTTLVDYDSSKADWGIEIMGNRGVRNFGTIRTISYTDLMSNYRATRKEMDEEVPDVIRFWSRY